MIENHGEIAKINLNNLLVNLNRAVTSRTLRKGECSLVDDDTLASFDFRFEYAPRDGSFKRMLVNPTDFPAEGNVEGKVCYSEISGRRWFSCPEYAPGTTPEARGVLTESFNRYNIEIQKSGIESTTKSPTEKSGVLKQLSRYLFGKPR